MSTTAATVTVGQAITLLEGKFAGRTATVREIGSTGRTMRVEWADGAKGFLFRDQTPVTVAA